MKQIDIYTDGGARPTNPGPAAASVVVLIDGQLYSAYSHFYQHATNNQMELQAAIFGLQIATTMLPAKVKIYTDSEYLRNGITDWLVKWKRFNWTTAAGQPVKNKEYWLQLEELKVATGASFDWVRAHHGNKFNELVDTICTTTITAGKQLESYAKTI